MSAPVPNDPVPNDPVPNDPVPADVEALAEVIADEFFRMQGGDPSWPSAPNFNAGDMALASTILAAGYARAKAGPTIEDVLVEHWLAFEEEVPRSFYCGGPGCGLIDGNPDQFHGFSGDPEFQEASFAAHLAQAIREQAAR